MAEANATILDLDAMLDNSLDAVPDAPDYQNPPPGLYMLAVEDAAIDSYEKDGEKKNRLKITYKVASTVETKEMPVPDGTLFTETFMASEQGLSFFKRQAKNIMDVSSLDGVPLREVLNSLKGSEFRAVLTTSKSSGKEGQVYENVRIRPQHEAAA